MRREIKESLVKLPEALFMRVSRTHAAHEQCVSFRHSTVQERVPPGLKQVISISRDITLNCGNGAL